MSLTPENYARGFLVDEEWMAGVTEDPKSPGRFVAFVLSHETGEYVAYQPFEALADALEALNKVPRKWEFERAGGCGGGSCGGGSCGTGQCGSGGCGEGC